MKSNMERTPEQQVASGHLDYPVMQNEHPLATFYKKNIESLINGDINAPKGHFLPDKVHYLNIPEYE